MKNLIILPESVKFIINKLIKANFKAYAVGGCVRDSLLGEEPHDWDICTNALPNETKSVFSEYKIIETGIKHGTVTLLIDSQPYEITTFRSETTYSDNRHPDNVIFEKNIDADLSRRDFTINAIAYNEHDGIIDLFNGQSDLKNNIISTVGDSDTRFNEDALRILRALRFASVLGFQIESNTKESIHKNKNLLKNVAVERIWVEFKKLILGKNNVEILREYADVISVFIPQINDMIGFEQKNPHHCYDVWEHTLHALSFASDDVIVRLAVFFHDIGKPTTFSVDEDGIGHFYGHHQVSREITKNVLENLKVDNRTKNDVVTLVEFHDRIINPNQKSVNKAIRKIGSRELFKKLCDVKFCDVNGQSPNLINNRITDLEIIRTIFKEVCSKDDFIMTVKDLEINGYDIMELGVEKGERIGFILETLFNLVVDNKVPNQNNLLKEKALKIINSDFRKI